MPASSAPWSPRATNAGFIGQGIEEALEYIRPAPSLQAPLGRAHSVGELQQLREEVIDAVALVVQLTRDRPRITLMEELGAEPLAGRGASQDADRTERLEPVCVLYGLPERMLIGFDNFHRKRREVPRIFFTHDNYLKDYTGDGDSKQAYRRCKVVLLVRDPRDVAVLDVASTKWLCVGSSAVVTVTRSAPPR